MRCGVYVMVRENRVRMFVPFANPGFANAWSAHLGKAPDIGMFHRFFVL